MVRDGERVEFDLKTHEYEETMTFREAVAKMREGHAVRRESWTDEELQLSYPGMQEHCYLIIAQGFERLLLCWGVGGRRKRIDVSLESADCRADDWVIFRPGVGCRSCRCRG